MGRRIKKAVYDWDATAGAYKTTTTVGSRFVYDGWNPVAELSLGALVRRTCTWGLDLSGSQQGAGGIGGLIVVKDYTADGKGVYYPAYDGGGNLTAMINADDGTAAATYEYSPYGELLTTTGDYASKNPFRFSTKYTDSETGLAYFGYRYYNPDTGRWLNRDPIEEAGGLNAYGYVNNEPLNQVDLLGLADCPTPCDPKTKKPPVLKCRLLAGRGKYLGLMHCYLQLSSGSRIGGYPDPGSGKLVGKLDDSRDTGGIDLPINVGDPCKFNDCAKNAMNDWNKTPPPYNKFYRNSNGFAAHIISKCGGSAEFPTGAWGGIGYRPKPINPFDPPGFPKIFPPMFY